MKVHIVRGSEVSQDRYDAVVEILQHYPGVLSFVSTSWTAEIKSKTTVEKWSETRLGRQNSLKKRSVFVQPKIVNHLHGIGYLSAATTTEKQKT